MKIRIIVLALVVFMGTVNVPSLYSQVIKPHGFVEIAYVPSRTFFEEYKDEFMSKIGFGVTVNLSGFEFDFGWSQETFATKSKGLFFHPNTQVYDYSMSMGQDIGLCRLTVFFSHQCVHPVDKDRFQVYVFDVKTKQTFQIHYTDFTQIGLRFEF